MRARRSRLRHISRLVSVLCGLCLVTLTVARPVGPADAHTPHDDIVDVEASPSYQSDHTLLAISDNRALRSTDGGVHWTESIRGLTGKTLAGFAFAPTEPRIVYLATRDGGVYKSVDGGQSWSLTNSPRAMASVTAVAVSPASADVAVAALTYGGVAQTRDGGLTWTIDPQYVRLYAMTFVPSHHNRLVGADAKGGMLVSDDAGATFAPARTDSNGDVATALTVANATTVVAGTQAGNTLLSSDGGSSWSRAGTIAAGDRIESVLASPNFARDHTLWASAWHSGAHLSTDGGRTWKPEALGSTTDSQADEIHSPQFRTLAFAVDGDQRRLYLGGYDGLFVWDDGAQRWSEIQTQAEYVTGLAVSPNYAHDGTVVVNTYVKGVFVSRDHGATFAPSDQGLGYHTGEGNKLLPLRRMHNVVFSPAYASDHTIFTAVWDHFVKSTDGGATWKEVLVATVPPADALRQFVIAVSPDYARDGTIYLGTRQGIVYRSTRRGDAGTWSTIARLGGRVRSIVTTPTFATDRTMFSSTVDGIRESTDGGSTWRSTGPAGISLLAISPDYARDGTLFAGTEHGLYVTHDGARSWTQLVTGLPKNTNVAALAVSPAFATDHTMLVSVTGTGLFRSNDGGRSFTPTGASLLSAGMVIADFDNPTSEPLQFSPQFARDHTVYAYAQQNVVRSTDGGTTWTVLPLPSSADFRSSWTRATATAKRSTSGASNAAVVIAIVIAIAAALGVGALLLTRRSSSARSGRTGANPA